MNGNHVEQAIYLFGFKTLGTIGRLNGLSLPPNLNCPDSFLPPKPPPKNIKQLKLFIYMSTKTVHLITDYTPSLLGFHPFKVRPHS